MKVSDWNPCGLGVCAAAAVLAGCGGSQPFAQSPGARPQIPAIGTHSMHADRRRSRMEGDAKSGDLLYVSDTETGDVYVFAYPKGTPKGTLTGLIDPAGECVDASGNVFVTNTGASNIVEYAHGGSTPIATLKDSGSFPVGCSVDPMTGNLAVTNFSTSGSGQGNVVVYKHARGRPTGHFSDPDINNVLLCGYDGEGNLFVDGLTSASGFAFAELHRRGSKLAPVALDQSISSAGGVQWDGKEVAVGDQAANVIYRFSIRGNKGTKVGATPLTGASEVFQFWIEDKRVIGPDAIAANVGIWDYPAGGSPTKTFGGVYVPLGATVSKAPQ